MSTTTIANITLLATALVALFAMLRWDLQNLQQNGYRNSNYNAWLKQSGDLSSLKRLLAAAVLFGTFTSMAMESWMVVMVLAAVLAALAVSVFTKRADRPLVYSSRVISVLIVAVVISLLAIGGAYLIGQRTGQAEATRSAATLAVILIVISPLLTMLANWILHPHQKRQNQGASESKDNIKE